MSRLVVLVFVLIFFKTDAKFPNNPKPCEFGDTDCIRDILSFLFGQNVGGYSSLNLVKIDPLKISSIDINQGKENPVNINLQFRNTDLIGLGSSKIIGVKGFGKDLTEQHEVHIRPSILQLVGDYTVSGKILILPTQGSGKSNITLENVNVIMRFSGVPQVKPDGTYLTIKSSNLTMDPERVHFEFGNLFNGDKALGDNLNLFLNENWKDIWPEVSESVGKAFAQIFEVVINTVFQKYPYDKFFALSTH